MRECGHLAALFSDTGNAFHHRTKCRCGITRNVAGTRDFARGGIHRLHGTADVVADTMHRRCDRFCRQRAFTRKLPDFIGNDRKPEPVFTGTRCFDCRVERQQIGLTRNA